MLWLIVGIITYILFWLTCISSYAISYLTDKIQITSFSQVLYTLSNLEGSGGSTSEAVWGFFGRYWFLLLVGTLIFAAFLYIWRQNRKYEQDGQLFFVQPKQRTAFYSFVAGISALTVGLFAINMYKGYEVLKVEDYINSELTYSTLYEDEFVEPSDVQLTFPEQKRNLLNIVVESYESTYTDTEHGGGYDNDLISSLRSIAQEEGVTFTETGSTALNGGYVMNNTGWTVAGLVAQSAGVPLMVGNGAFNRTFEADTEFMPHLITLNDILEEAGYTNVFFCGSNGSFAGRSNYYEQHGSTIIKDYNTAIAEGLIDEGYYVWWGYEDEKLYEFAKAELEELAAAEEPFNMTLLTADSHFTDGYLCQLCPDDYDSQYENVIKCTDNQLSSFIRWVQQQEWYENTTVVVSGDHLSMDASVGQTAGEEYVRKTFSFILNGPEYTLNKTREYSTLDMFPTILASLNVQIEGNRLGLGTNLYSETETLVEKYGYKKFNKLISQKSRYYTDVILSGDQSELIVIPADETTGEVETVQDVPVSAQEYQENKELFDDSSYIYQPGQAALDYYYGTESGTVSDTSNSGSYDYSESYTPSVNYPSTDTGNSGYTPSTPETSVPETTTPETTTPSVPETTTPETGNTQTPDPGVTETPAPEPSVPETTTPSAPETTTPETGNGGSSEGEAALLPEGASFEAPVLPEVPATEGD
jgi:phosphoglycerol transferase